MLRCTLELLRRGKPRPAVSLLFEKYRRVPAALKPEQLGQQYFSEFLIRDANEEEMMRQQQQEWEQYNNINSSNYNMNSGSGSMAQPYNANAESKAERNNNDDNSVSNNTMGDNTIRARHGIYPIMPQMDVYNMLDKASAEHIAAEMEEVIRNDAFQSQRVFNERDWIDEERERIQQYESNNKNTKSKEEMLKQQAEQRLLESNSEFDNNNNTKNKSIVDDIRAVAQEMSTLRELSTTSHHPNSITNTIQSSQDNAHFIESGPGSLSENVYSNSEHHNLPEPVLDNDYFESRHGYSLLKKVSTEATMASPFTEYSQLDL